MENKVPHGEEGHLCHAECAGYAEGGQVTEGDAQDPSIIPEDIKELIDAAHKEQRESRPDEGWRVKPSEKPESVAPYKCDDEDLPDDTDLGTPEPLGFAKGGVVPGYDDGGAVAPDPNALLQAIAPAGTGILTPSPAQQPPNQPQIAQATPTVAPAPAISRETPLTLSDQDFTDRANKMLGLNPQEQAAFLKLLGDNTQKGQIGAGIAGIGDAIASGGTLGKVNPGNLAKSEEIIQGREKAGVEGMQGIRGNQEKSVELGMKLQSQDPNSALSKYAQKAYAGVGKKIGIDLSHASAALIADVTGKGVEALNSEYEAELKRMGLGLQKEQVEATIGNQKAERALAREGHQQDAAKALADQGILKKAANIITPSGRAATNVLERTASGQPAPVNVNSMEEYKAIPSGTHYIDSYGNEKVKK